MAEPLQYGAVPKPLIEGMEHLGSPPPPGSGRIRVDLSVNVWTLFSLIVLFVILGFAADRLHSQVEDLTRQVTQMAIQQDFANRRLMRLETHDIMLRQDLRGFPLHRHVDKNRLDMYPQKYDAGLPDETSK